MTDRTLCTIVAVAVLAAAACFAMARRAARETAKRDRVIAEASHRTPAILDTEHGIDTALQDECELLWEMPAREPGPERLLSDIRRQQEDGRDA